MSIRKKVKVDKNECKYILLRIDVYFTEYFLAVEIDEKKPWRQRTYFWKKKQEVLEKSLVVNLLELTQVMQKMAMIQTMKVVKYNYLSVNLKTKKKKKKTQ